MPPAKKRPRTYDSAKVRAAVLAQFGHVRDVAAGLTPQQLELPTRLGDWTVRELVAHVAMAVGAVPRYLRLPEPARQDVALLDWPFATVTAAAQVDLDTRELAAGDLGELYERTAERVGELLPLLSDERLVPTRFGAMRLGDFLVTRTVELVVHTDDLADATGLDVPYDRQALAACTRLLADALAVKAPGASTEVRIPPFAVVQCVEGPRHTRGTPPNVVETDPLTWIRLATGRTGWREALEAAKVSASGERADLGGLLPILA
ncbi:maleylpyruvate isomerase family mycothiol-dependent enzyme [Streptomyces sp. PKU-EA00015]|uniref:maleylpyruvate isomerase family mycothiol-dependent enzyme n=1 Tax=Streptomyces sp. PKU-EA00015 TaxID=2748326 RepID=UPI0015A19A87|nr:maleylpyruvate isomerase family mycothiol-dependent enzyme [Streptomyces sp. PKU-EA00015]NWF31359.1 maleylpyruvate isomerase family mycothiol-dependent enzyme [Streptomyces sp. PKU-EA00015]